MFFLWRFFIYHDRPSNESKWFISFFLICPTQPPVPFFLWFHGHAYTSIHNHIPYVLHPLMIQILSLVALSIKCSQLIYFIIFSFTTAVHYSALHSALKNFPIELDLRSMKMEFTSGCFRFISFLNSLCLTFMLYFVTWWREYGIMCMTGHFCLFIFYLCLYYG